MLSLLTALKSKLKGGPGNSGLLNEGLRLMLDPMGHERELQTRYPYLSDSEMEDIISICRSAYSFGFQAVAVLAKESGPRTNSDRFNALISARFPWVEPENMSRLFSQGMYSLR